MDKKILRLTALLLVMAVAAGCGGFNKMLKSKDNDAKYKQGLKYYDARKYQKSLQLFEQVLYLYDGTPRGDSIRFYMAAACYNMGDFESSGMLFDEFRRQNRNSPFLEEAEYLYAMGYYYASPGPQRDQTNTIKAMIAIGEYLDRYPNSVKKDALNNCTEELRNKVYDKEFLNAKCYYTIGSYKSAVIALRNALEQSPENPHREEMMYLTAKSGYLLAKHSVERLQKDRYLNMMDYYLNFVSEFPNSEYVPEVGKMMEEAKQYIAEHDTETQNNTSAENGS